MPLLNLHISPELAQELTSLGSDLETVVMDAIRQYLDANVSEGDIANAAAQDNATDFLSRQEVDYYLSL